MRRTKCTINNFCLPVFVLHLFWSCISFCLPFSSWFGCLAFLNWFGLLIDLQVDLVEDFWVTRWSCSSTVANSIAVPLPFSDWAHGGIGLKPESSPDQMCKGVSWEIFCRRVLHSMALQWLVHTIPTIEFLLVVERTGLLCYRVLSVSQLPVCSTCIFWNQSVVMIRTNLVLVMEGLLYWRFLNLRVQFTCIFVHLRLGKKCSLFWLYCEYLQYPCLWL